LHRYRYAPKPFETVPDVVFIGQTPFDTSIVRYGEYVRLPEFMPELEGLKPKKNILYKKGLKHMLSGIYTTEISGLSKKK
jgi:hypothetical protein